ncbi:MAG: hypothetical protein IJV34_04755 [Prevotella sp.]|nr:hypothetical protein [Prevotella sp.]
MGKTLLTLIAWVVAAATAHADAPPIIYTQPEGRLYVYERHGRTIDENGEGALDTLYQEGKLNVVFSADNSVYIQGLVAKDVSNSWLKGSLSNDGTTITVAMGQYVDYTRSFDMAYQLAMFDFDSTDNTYKRDSLTTEVTLTVDGNDLRLNGTSQNRLLGFVIRTFGNPQGAAIGQSFDYLNNMWIGYGDYDTVLTYADEQPQQAPADLQTQTYYFTSAEYDGASYSSFSSTVLIGQNGDDVWVQGLCKYLPNAWIRGHWEGERLLFSSGQYLGAYADYPIYMQGGGPDASGQEIELKNVEMTFDGQRYQTFDYIFLSTNRDQIEYVNFYMGATFDEQPDTLVVAPVNLSTKAYTLAYKDENNKAVSRSVAVGFSDDNFYVKGIWEGLPESWVSGTIGGDGSATIELPQYLGDYTDPETGRYAMYLTAFDAKTGALLPSLTLSYDSTTRSFGSPSSPLSVGINKTGFLSIQDYYSLTLTNDALNSIGGPSVNRSAAAEYFDLQGRKAYGARKGLLIKQVRRADGNMETIKVVRK